MSPGLTMRVWPRWASGDERAAVGISALVVGLFASPSLLAAALGADGVGEPAFGRIVVRALAGIGPLVAGASVATLTWSKDTRTRRVANALVSAGAAPFGVALAVLARRVFASALGAALSGGALVLAVRAALHIGGGSALAFDAAATAWSVFLGASAWTALAVATIARTPRAFVPFTLIVFDVAMRALPDSLSWFGPSAHLANLLGAPPTTGALGAHALPQNVSVLVLASYACVGVLLASARYDGVRARA